MGVIGMVGMAAVVDGMGGVSMINGMRWIDGRIGLRGMGGVNEWDRWGGMVEVKWVD